MQDTGEAQDCESDDEVLEEPKFKYKRMINDLLKIFDKDAASVFVVHDKLLALGTQWGKVFILDHLGNITNEVTPCHTAAVNQLSIDSSGEYVASCSNDGKVIIFGLCSTEFSQVVSMERPIRSISLDPNYGKSNSGQQFVTGDRVLVLHERRFLFSKNKQTVIFASKEREEFIHNIHWRGPYICFANEGGLRIYDREQQTMITHVLPKHDPNLRSELYPAHIHWIGDTSFVVGWANTVTVGNIKSPSVGQKFVELTNMFSLPDYFVSGVCNTFPDNFLVLFCVCRVNSTADADESSEIQLPDENLPERPRCPRVLLIEPHSLDTFGLLSEDIIEMNDCDKLLCHNYHMTGLAEDNTYFLLGNRDLITVRPCNADDHVDWLLANDKWKVALEFTSEHEVKPSNERKVKEPLERYTEAIVGRLYLEHLIEEKKYDEAAQLCVQVCGKKKDMWEDYVTKFEQEGQLKALASVLPTTNPQLEPECYEMILSEFLRDDIRGFKKIINDWSPDLYRVGAIIKETIDKLYQANRVVNMLDPTSRDLLETLAQLYTFERNYSHAIALYLKLEHKNVFQLVEKYHLFALVKDKIHDLMRIDTNLAVRLLLDNEDSLPAATVVKQLSKQPKLQLAYLDRLFARNEGADFADLAVNLYAEHNPKRLLAFLRNNSEHYKLEKALEICRQRRLLEAEVFLLARSGNRREALRVILRESRDIHQAIDFCKEHDDNDLWNDLIAEAVKRPEFVTILMQNIGTHVDPTLLIRQIPGGMTIPGLRDSLVKTLKDYNTQISLQEGCQRVLKNDCHQLQLKMLNQLRRGRRVGADMKCSICGLVLFKRRSIDPRLLRDLIRFNCDHIFHSACFEELTAESFARHGATPRRNEVKSCHICESLET